MSKLFVMSVLLIAALACIEGEQIINSDSGLYKAFLTIEEDTEGHRIRVVNIRGCSENADLTLAMEDYPAFQMAYIAWQEDDRLWFYSSDDGRYFYWEHDRNGWEIYSWSLLESSMIHPPDGLGDGNGVR